MSALQVRDFPDDLRALLVQRAGQQGVSLSEFVTRTLRAELSRPSIDDWARGVRSRSTGDVVDVTGVLDDVRAEYDPDPR